MKVFLFTHESRVIGSYIAEDITGARKQLRESFGKMGDDTLKEIQMIDKYIAEDNLPIVEDRRAGLANYIEQMQEVINDKDPEISKKAKDNVAKSTKEVEAFISDVKEETKEQLKGLNDMFKLYKSPVEALYFAEMDLKKED